MFYRDPGGLGPYLGLSSDERLGVQFLYPKTGLLTARGSIKGVIQIGVTNVLGAVVIAEDAAGNIASASVSRSDGSYYLPALPPATYTVRVSPLDGAAANPFLVRGSEIGPAYASAFTGFLHTAGTNVLVTANQTKTLDLKLTARVPALRIVGIRMPTRTLAHPFPANATATVRVGESNYYIGIYSRDALAGAVLSVRGGGVTLRSMSVTNAWGYNLLYASVDVAPNAVPGLRSLTVQRGSDVSYANGFFEVAPAWPDDNFDGLDDWFQRRFFPLWVAPQAGPASDPDGDGFNNQYEYLAGSNPVSPSSVPTVELDDVTLTATGTTLGWTAVTGARYQVWRRDTLAPTDVWKKVGAPVAAVGDRVEFLDTASKERFRFYQVELLPGF